MANFVVLMKRRRNMRCGLKLQVLREEKNYLYGSQEVDGKES